jgi:predicted transcriptional regulator
MERALRRDAWLRRAHRDQYLERQERREQLPHDALAAWTEYQATGLPVTGDEADAWLSRLEVGEDAPVPSANSFGAGLEGRHCVNNLSGSRTGTDHFN